VRRWVPFAFPFAVCLLGCGGARPHPDPDVGPMRRPTLGETTTGEPELYGVFDATGKPHGEWAFDCGGVPRGCRGWFEHGVQEQWGWVQSAMRIVVEAHAGGWRWQQWEGDRLTGEAFLSEQPRPWTPAREAEFFLHTLPLESCSGEFRTWYSDGTLAAHGTCHRGRWATRLDHRDTGVPYARASRTDAEEIYEELAPDGTVVERSVTAGESTTTDTWRPDGTKLRHDDPVLSQSWHPNGQLASEDRRGAFEVVEKRWAPNGTLLSDIRFVDGEPVGWVRTYYDDGKRRSAIRYSAEGVPLTHLTVWSPRGDRVGLVDLTIEGRWTDHKAGPPTSVRAVHVPAGDGLLAGLRCQKRDAECLLLVGQILRSDCYTANIMQAQGIWRGRITLALGVDERGQIVVEDIPKPGGLTIEQRACALEPPLDGEAAPVIVRRVLVDVDVDTLVTFDDVRESFPEEIAPP
jgi:hypothetical protein